MQPAELKDPFAMDGMKDALPTSNSNAPRPERRSVPEAFRSGSVMGGTEWRISQGMVTTLLALSKAHFSRGSPRETEYFALQAQDLAKSVSLDFLVGQALLRRGELQLSLGKLDTAGTLLVEAIDSIGETATLELVDAYRLLGVYDSLNQEEDSAGERYASAVATLAQLRTDLSSSELTQV
jgi:separase